MHVLRVRATLPLSQTMSDRFTIPTIPHIANCDGMLLHDDWVIEDPSGDSWEHCLMDYYYAHPDVAREHVELFTPKARAEVVDWPKLTDEVRRPSPSRLSTVLRSGST